MSNSRPWDRLPDETEKSFAAFVLYRDMREERSFANLRAKYTNDAPKAHKQKKQTTPALTTVKQWSIKYHWQARCKAFDAENDRIHQQASFEVTERTAEELAYLRSEQRQKELDMSRKLLDRAQEMLDVPLLAKEVKEVVKVGKKEIETVVTYLPAAWRARDALGYAELASKLSRLGLDMNTDQVGVSQVGTNPEQTMTDLRDLLENPETREAMAVIGRTLAGQQNKTE